MSRRGFSRDREQSAEAKSIDRDERVGDQQKCHKWTLTLKVKKTKAAFNRISSNG